MARRHSACRPCPLGDHSYSTTYAGDAVYGPAVSGTATVNVNDLPRVSLFSPTDGTQYNSPTTLFVEGAANGVNGTRIMHIDLFDNGVPISSKMLTPPGSTSVSFTFVVNTPAAGLHAYSAAATDDCGMVGDPAVTHVTVIGAATVAITAPTNGSFQVAPGFVSLQATASSQNGGITQIQYLANGVSLGTATAAPYNLTWSNVPAGNYTLIAQATDSAGAVAVSAPVQLVVGSAPTVTVTRPSQGATIADDVISTLTGTIQSPSNSSVRVNGMLATVGASGTFVGNNVPLRPGNNTIQVLVTTAEGVTATQAAVQLHSSSVRTLLRDSRR